MAALQHSIFVRYGFITIDRGNLKFFAIIRQFCPRNALDSLNAHLAQFFHVQFSFASNTDNVSFFPVYTVFLNQLVKAVGITWLQTDKSFSL